MNTCNRTPGSATSTCNTDPHEPLVPNLSIFVMSLSPAIVLRNVPANTPSAPLVHAHRRLVPDNTIPSLRPVSGTTPKRGNDAATGVTATHLSHLEIRGPGHEYFSSPRKCDDRKPLLAPHGRPYGSPAYTGQRSPHASTTGPKRKMRPTPSCPLKKGTGSEPNTVPGPENHVSRGACLLFQQPPS